MSLHTAETQEFVGLLTGHQSAIRCFIISLMPGSSDVQDVLQDTNLVIWEKMASFQLGTDFRAWSFAIAKNVAMDHLRKVKRDRSPVLDKELMGLIADTWHGRKDDVDNTKEIALDRCLGELSKAEATIVQARYRSGSSLESYSADCGRPVGSLRVSLFRIRAKLRECVRKRIGLMGGAS